MREDWYNIKNIASETWHVAKRLKRGHRWDLSIVLVRKQYETIEGRG